MTPTPKTVAPMAMTRAVPMVTRTVTVSTPAHRAFKVLQPSRASAQMSLFPPPGAALRGTR